MTIFFMYLSVLVHNLSRAKNSRLHWFQNLLVCLVDCPITYTVEPVFSGPRDERPPAMYGQFFRCPQSLFNRNVPEMRGHLVDADSVFFHLLGRTVNFIMKKLISIIF